MFIKPSSVPYNGDNHLSTLIVTNKLKRHNPEGSASNIIPSLFGLAPNGVYQASQSLDCWCALTAPFHPYRLLGGTHFCGTSLEVTFTGHYPAFCSMELGLSSFTILIRNRDYLSHSHYIYYRIQTNKSSFKCKYFFSTFYYNSTLV